MKKVVKAYKDCVLDDGNCDDCPYEACGCGIDGHDIIDIINRQKAEIERLMEERDMYADDLYWKAEVRKREDFITELTVEKAKLQKQVALLNDRLVKTTEAIDTALYVIDNGKKKVEQAVKDTAKEILDEVSKHFGGKWLVNLYKKYGLEWNVEVE